MSQQRLQELEMRMDSQGHTLLIDMLPARLRAEALRRPLLASLLLNGVIAVSLLAASSALTAAVDVPASQQATLQIR